MPEVPSEELILEPLSDEKNPLSSSKHVEAAAARKRRKHEAACSVMSEYKAIAEVPLEELIVNPNR